MFVKNVFRDLKKRFGLAVDVYKITASSTSDIGITTRSLTKKSVKRALILKSKNSRISVNGGFLNPATIGGLFDISERSIVIDRADLSDFKITPQDYLIFDSRKYEITQVGEIEQAAAYVLMVKETTNDVFNQIYDVNVYHVVSVHQEVST